MYINMDFYPRFSTDKLVKVGLNIRTNQLCFTHAVQAAGRNEDVEMTISEEESRRCDVCNGNPSVERP